MDEVVDCLTGYALALNVDNLLTHLLTVGQNNNTDKEYGPKPFVT